MNGRQIWCSNKNAYEIKRVKFGSNVCGTTILVAFLLPQNMFQMLAGCVCSIKNVLQTSSKNIKR